MKDAQLAWSISEIKSLLYQMIVSIETEEGYTTADVMGDLEEALELLDGVESGARMKGGMKLGDKGKPEGAAAGSQTATGIVGKDGAGCPQE